MWTHTFVGLGFGEYESIFSVVRSRADVHIYSNSNVWSRTLELLFHLHTDTFVQSVRCFPS